MAEGRFHELESLLVERVVLFVWHERFADGDLAAALVLRGECGAVGGHLQGELRRIHECLHLLYTDFPPRFLADSKFNTKNKKIAIGMIANIIEDSYIEAVGCSYFDNMEFYLKFGRVARLFANHPSEGTVNQRFGKIVQAEKEIIEAKAAEEEKKTGIKQELPKRTNGERLVDFLNHMATFLLYPMVRDEAIEEDIIIYVEAAKPLFFQDRPYPTYLTVKPCTYL